MLALGSAGRYLRRSLADFPQRTGGYLLADAARIAHLRSQIARGGFRTIGLAWHSINPIVGKDRSIALERLRPVLHMPGCRFVDLQYGDTQQEREDLEGRHGLRIEHLSEIDNYRDIDGLAALIGTCDLVITIDNTTVHLAGALGKPTWLLLPFAADWRWLLNRDDTPWYSTVRLFRQPRADDWESVLQKVARTLAQ